MPEQPGVQGLCVLTLPVPLLGPPKHLEGKIRALLYCIAIAAPQAGKELLLCRSWGGSGGGDWVTQSRGQGLEVGLPANSAGRPRPA